jgi:NAD(P)-dependent dehydrogenase (short-subunit alcohol dehydrogenase family)
MVNRFDLTGKRALVTGARRAIGRAIALGLAENGAAVAIHHRGADEAADAESVANAARALGVKAATIAADFAEDGSGHRAFEAARTALGRIDILVINASIEIRTDYTMITTSAFERQMAVNLRATVELFQAAIPPMIEHGWGRVVTIGSIQQAKPHPQMLVYAGAKAAQANMARSLARQVGGKGVTVNNLAPGAISTERNADMLADPDYRARIETQIPVGRLGTPEDLVGAALLLCSDAGAYINGVDLYVDGGFHIS